MDRCACVSESVAVAAILGNKYRCCGDFVRYLLDFGESAGWER